MHSPQFSGQGCGASTQLSSCVGRLKRWYIPPQYRHFTLLYGQILLWSFSWARRNEPTQPRWHFLSEYSHCAWWLSFSWCSPLQEHPGTVHCTLILAMIACRGTEMLNWVWLIVARQSEQLFERPYFFLYCPNSYFEENSRWAPLADFKWLCRWKKGWWCHARCRYGIKLIQLSVYL